MGSNCEATCPFPTYGGGCQMKCNCIDKDCDPVNGCNKSSPGVHNYVSKCIIPITCMSFAAIYKQLLIFFIHY